MALARGGRGVEASALRIGVVAEPRCSCRAPPRRRRGSGPRPGGRSGRGTPRRGSAGRARSRRSGRPAAPARRPPRRARSASAHGADSAAGSGSRCTVPSSRASTRSASGRCSGSSRRTCSAPEPTDALSWPGVPSAITLPWSITAIPSASWSASSRYCVQSRIVVPSAAQRADDVPHLVARARVEAGGRLVEEHQLGRDDDAGGDVEPAPHAAGVVLDEPAGGVGEAERLEQLGRARLGRRRA